MILFQSTCGFHHKFGKFSVNILTLLVVSFTCSYSTIVFNLVLVKQTLFGSFVFCFPLFLCFLFSYKLILVVYAKVDIR